MATSAALRDTGEVVSLRLVHSDTKPRRTGSSGPSRKRKRSPLGVVILVVLTVFGVAALQAWVGQDGLHAAALERELQHEQERMTLLSARVAQLSSPQRLRDEAGKLGLVADPAPRYLKAPVELRDRPTPSGGITKRLNTPTP